MVRKQIKQREDAIALYAQAGRTEQVEKEQSEIGVLAALLPSEMTETEILPILEAVVISKTWKSFIENSELIKRCIKKAVLSTVVVGTYFLARFARAYRYGLLLLLPQMRRDGTQALPFYRSGTDPCRRDRQMDHAFFHRSVDDELSPAPPLYDQYLRNSRTYLQAIQGTG